MNSGKQFSIIGATITGNRGAEAMLCTTVGRMRADFPDATFHLFSYYPKEDSGLVTDPAIRVWDARPLPACFLVLMACLWRTAKLVKLERLFERGALKALIHSDALLDIQGISFNDSKLLALPYKVASILPALMVGTKVFKLSQAMGPFKNWLNRTAAKICLSKCSAVVSRGAHTANFVEGLGLPQGKCTTAADIAFAYEPSFSLTRENEEKLGALAQSIGDARKSGLIVAVSPSSVVNNLFRKKGRCYVAELADLIREITGKGHTVVVVPNANRETATSRNNDLAVIAALQKEFSTAPATGSVFLVDFTVNTAGLHRLIAQADVLLASRFHGMVGGLSLAVPTLVVGWSHKYMEVLEMFGLQEYALSWQASSEETLRAFNRLCNDREAVGEKLRAHLPSIQRSAVSQFELVRSSL
jgi:colanic acid/amylovoran biosynthesis protein